MAKVIFWGNLKTTTGGDVTHDVAADTIRQMLDILKQRFPHLDEILETGSTISIDGNLYNDDWFRPIAENSEIHILPRIEGG